MREVFERLETLSVPYFLTGSEALARYGQPRQTMDVDIVVGVELPDFERLSPGCPSPSSARRHEGT